MQRIINQTPKVVRSLTQTNVSKTLFGSQRSFHRAVGSGIRRDNIVKIRPEFKQEQKRSYQSMNVYSPGLSNTELYTGLGGLAALIGVGYFASKYWNTPSVAVNDYGVSTTTSHSIPTNVQDYLLNTYKYVVAGLGITAGAAVVAFKQGLVYRIMNLNPWMHLLIFGGATIGSMLGTMMIRPENTVPKHLMFTAFNVIMGVSLCSLGFVAPQILYRAGLYTLAMVGGLSYVAMTAKQDRFLYLGGPLMAGLCVLIAASFSRMLLPARFIGTLALMDGLVLYGGLALFGAYMLYDTQRIMAEARTFSGEKSLTLYNGERNVVAKPDYINASIALYMNIINIFVRLVAILSNSNRRK